MKEIFKNFVKALLRYLASVIAVVVLIALGVTAVVCGCRHITIEKRDAVPYPTATNAVLVAEGGYDFSYWNCGMKTDIDSIKADKGKDEVKIEIGNISTDVSDKHSAIVTSGGDAIGAVAEKVIEGIKGIETIKLQNGTNSN